MTESAPSSVANAGQPLSGATGRRVVLGMLVLGMLATAGIWVYWKLNLGPFVPMQRALAEAFPASSPRVEGGRQKGSTDVQLRVVLRVDFTPTLDDERVAPIVDKVTSLAREHGNLARYDRLVIYIVHFRPQRRPEEIKIDRPTRELIEQSPR
jgi:hypothetical protein